MAKLVEFRGLRMSPLRKEIAKRVMAGQSCEHVARMTGATTQSVLKACSSLRERGLDLPMFKRVTICARSEDGEREYRFDGKRDVEERGGFCYATAHWAASREKKHGGFIWWIER